MQTKRIYIFLLSFASLVGLSASLWAKSIDESLQTAVAPALLEQNIIENIQKVELFAKLAEAAKKRGVRLWIMGGVASSFGHYVRWDMLRREGDKNFLDSRFNYNFANIIRAQQDLDLVTDGSHADAEFLKAYAESLVKIKVDVSLLHQDRPNRPAVLGPQFLNQNSDTHSQGMIELTESAKEEARIRTASRFNEKGDHLFLNDLASASIQFLPHPLHNKSKRAEKGENPEIFSVIRYFVKVGQFDLRIPADSEQQIKSIIDKANILRETSGAYATGWIDKYSTKLLTQSISFGKLKKKLAELGLLFKLRALSRPGSFLEMALQKEELPTQPIGIGKGRSAKHLGIRKLTHATPKFDNFDSLSGAPVIRPNALFSRVNFAHERTDYGTGFYAEKGHLNKSHYGSYILHLELDPEAIEGIDFIEGDYIRIMNLNAIRVVDEDFTELRSSELLRTDDEVRPGALTDAGLSTQGGQSPNSIAHFLGKKPPYRLIIGLVAIPLFGYAIAASLGNRRSDEKAFRTNISEATSSSTARSLALKVENLELPWLHSIIGATESDRALRGLTMEFLARNPSPIDFELFFKSPAIRPDMVREDILNYLKTELQYNKSARSLSDIVKILNASLRWDIKMGPEALEFYREAFFNYCNPIDPTDLTSARMNAAIKALEQIPSDEQFLEETGKRISEPSAQRSLNILRAKLLKLIVKIRLKSQFTSEDLFRVLELPISNTLIESEFNEHTRVWSPGIFVFDNIELFMRDAAAEDYRRLALYAWNKEDFLKAYTAGFFQIKSDEEFFRYIRRFPQVSSGTLSKFLLSKDAPVESRFLLDPNQALSEHNPSLNALTWGHQTWTENELGRIFNLGLSSKAEDSDKMQFFILEKLKELAQNRTISLEERRKTIESVIPFGTSFKKGVDTLLIQLEYEEAACGDLLKGVSKK